MCAHAPPALACLAGTDSAAAAAMRAMCSGMLLGLLSGGCCLGRAPVMGAWLLAWLDDVASTMLAQFAACLPCPPGRLPVASWQPMSQPASVHVCVLGAGSGRRQCMSMQTRFAARTAEG